MSEGPEARIRRLVASEDWSAWRDPIGDQADRLPPAIHGLLESSEDTDWAAQNRMLFAIGNNHAGTLYPLAGRALHFVLDVALSCPGWPRWSALGVLVDAISFEQAGDSESVIPVIDVVQAGAVGLTEIAGSLEEYDEVRAAAFELLALADRPPAEAPRLARDGEAPRLGIRGVSLAATLAWVAGWE